LLFSSSSGFWLTLRKTQTQKKHEHEKATEECHDSTEACNTDAKADAKDQKAESMDNKADKTDKTDQKAAESVDTPTTAWNAVCPVLGKAVNPKIKPVVYDGKAYGFCCAGCDSKFEKNPEKYIKNLNADGTRFIGKK